MAAVPPPPGASNGAPTAAAAGATFTASDFFGANDPDSVDKFKTIALRALYDQKIEVELKNTRLDKQKLQTQNEFLASQAKQLKECMDANIDDRERVLAFKTKRIDELQVKVKDYEAINASLLQTINGYSPESVVGGAAGGAQGGAAGGAGGAPGGASGAGSEAGRNTSASVLILQRGLPLFHAVETCKELEYKRLLDDKKLQCDVLQKQIAENDDLMREMHHFQREKQHYLQQIEQFQTQLVQMAVEKDEKIHFLERKLVFEHDRLAKEKAHEIALHQNDMEKQLTIQLDATTQRTIEENAHVQLELRYQNGHIEKLIKQVDALQQSYRKVSHERQLMDERNTILSTKIRFYEQLFSKMQQKDHKQQQNGGMADIERTESSPSRRAMSRKPPLPSSPRCRSGGNEFEDGGGRRSAFPLPTYAPSPSSSSPPPPRRSPLSREQEQEEEDGLRLDPLSLDLDLDALDLLGDQLNSVVSELDSHFQKREFARKQVNAMVQHHTSTSGSRRTNPDGLSSSNKNKSLHPQKRTMRMASEYSPSSYMHHGSRRLVQAPLTLDVFIQEHATISPRNTSTRKRPSHRILVQTKDTASSELKLPVLAGSPAPPSQAPRTDGAAMWKTSTAPQRTDDRAASHTAALTARF